MENQRKHRRDAMTTRIIVIRGTNKSGVINIVREVINAQTRSTQSI